MSIVGPEAANPRILPRRLVVVCGLLVALGIGLGLVLVLGIVPAHPLIAIGFVALGAAFMGALGIVAGVFADKFDQMAAITNFIVTPLAFLSGTFYSVQALPPAPRPGPAHRVRWARVGAPGNSAAAKVWAVRAEANALAARAEVSAGSPASSTPP